MTASLLRRYGRSGAPVPSAYWTSPHLPAKRASIMAAAPILSWEGLGLNQGTSWLFKDLDLQIGPRDRLALIGRNGAGKTTLLKLIAGLIDADKGTRSVQPGTRVVTLEQDPFFTGFDTLMDFALSGKDAPPRHEVESIAGQLGIDLSRKADSASGGERRRAALARALASEPDLLLLDEPTNHLDLAAIEWLEDWLGRFKGAFVVISHDRTFLTRLTKAVLWLDRGQIRRLDQGYGAFDAWAEEIHAREEVENQKLARLIHQEEIWARTSIRARRTRNEGRMRALKALRAERQKRLQGMPPGAAALAAEAGASMSSLVIEAERLSKSYGGRAIVQGFSTRILRGDKLGVIGPNGAGKTTLVKLLTGELQPDSGERRQARDLVVARVDQTRSVLSPAITPWEFLAGEGDTVSVQGQRRHVVGYLRDFLFSEAQARQPVRSLSGGERNRLLLARALAEPCDLLVLDEPTNDLDLDTLELLEETLAAFQGTLIVVSHDRAFLDRVATSVVASEGGGRWREYPGGYSDYLAQRPQTPASEPAAAKPAATAAAPAEKPKRAAKLSYGQQRVFDMLEKEIPALTQRIAALEADLGSPAIYADAAKAAQRGAELAAARARLAAAEEEWLTLAALKEELEG